MVAPLQVFWNKVDQVTASFHPISASFEITNRCNAACAYCYQPDKSGVGELSTEQALLAIDKINSAGVLYLHITGGEPFLRSDIVRLLERVFWSDFFGVSIFTNGTIVSDRHVDLLASNRMYVNSVRLTVFSHIDEVHDSYTQVSGGLRKIVSLCDKLLKKNVAVELSLPVMDFNIGGIDETLNAFKKKGIKVSCSLSKLVTKSNAVNGIKDMASKSFYLRYLKTVADKKDIYLIDRLKQSANSDCINNSLCRGLRHGVAIDSCGMLRPCVSFRNLTVGSIFQDKTLPEILAGSADYCALSRLTKKNLLCKSCRFYNFCQPCIAHWLTENDSINEPAAGDCNFANACNEYFEGLSSCEAV